MRKTLPRLIPLSFIVLLAGCSTYSAKPLDPKKHWEALESATVENILEHGNTNQPGDSLELSAVKDAGALSIDHLMTLVLIANPELQAIRLKEGVANAQLVEAGLLPNPEFDVRLLSPLEGGGVLSEVSALLNITESFLLRGTKEKRAEVNLAQVRWEIADVEWELLAETKRLYTTAQFYREALVLNTEQLKVAESLFNYINRSRSQGAASNLDVMLVETEIFDVKVELKRLSREYDQSIYDLNALLGLPPTYKLPVKFTKFSLSSKEVDLTESTNNMRKCHPSLLAFEQAYLGSDIDLELQFKKKFFPPLELGPSFEGEGGDSSLGGVLSFELPIFNQGQSRIAERESKREKQEALYVLALHKQRQALVSSWNKYDKLQDSLEYYFQTVLPRLESGINLLRKAYEGGETNLVNLILQQNKVLKTKREVVEQLRELYMAEIDVNAAKGPSCI